MDPIWHHTAQLLAAARLTRSDRTLTVVAWKMVAVGVLGAAVLAGGAHEFGWRAGDPRYDPIAPVPAHATAPRSAAAAGDAITSTRAPLLPAQQPRASGDEAACRAGLNDAGVSFRIIPKDQAPGVAWPIELRSAVGGVLIHGGKKNAPTNYLDCRLALALLAWEPSLREAGVVGLEHFSFYRRDAVVGASSKTSGHAFGFAIDVGRFEMSDGRTLSVLEDWTNRDRGADACRWWPTDTEANAILRKLVCDAYEDELFQGVITPHYNDAHKNHVHLEIAPKSQDASID